MVSSLNTTKQEIIFIKIEDYIVNNFSYYKSYNPLASKFSTFLYKDILLTTIKVLREENLKEEYYSFSKLQYLSEISDDIMAAPQKAFLLEGRNFFKSKKELVNWLKQKPFTQNEIKKILETVTRKEHYYEKFISYEENKATENTFYDALPSHDLKHFLSSLHIIEKDPVFRLILKIVLNININYLNTEILHLKKTTVNLDLINSLKSLYNHPWSANKGNFFSLAHKIIGSYSQELRKIRPSSIQQRVIRDFKKFKELYTQNELHELLISVRDTFDINMLETSPLFLSLYSTKDFDFTIEENSFNNLKAVDLSNSRLSHYPFATSEAGNVEYIDISYNSFSGVPDELYQLTAPKIIVISNQGCKLNTKSIKQYKSKHPDCRIIE